MQKYLIWLISAGVAIPTFFIATAAGLGEIPVLILTFVGSMAGAVLGTVLMQRRAGPASGTPPGQGSGKTEA